MNHRRVGWTVRAAVIAVVVSVTTPLRISAGQGRTTRLIVPDPPGSTLPRRLTKPRISPLPDTLWTDVHRKLVAKYQPEGRAGNALKTLLQVPELVDGTMPFQNYITRDSSLSPRHREILILRTSWLLDNDFVWAEHAAIARKLGMTTNELRRIAQGPGARGWDAFEETLIRLADQLFRNSAVTDATWRTLATQYDMFHMLDAVMTVADFTSMSLLYNAIGIQADGDAADHLPRDIQYRVVVPPREPALTIPRIEPLEGRGLAITRTFQRYPTLAEPRNTGSNYVNRRSKLDARYRELLILRTGWNCQSEYEWSQHVGSVGRAREKGLDPLKIAEGPSAKGWDPFEIVLLDAADELYRDSTISDRTWNAMAVRFDPTMLLDATITAANYRMVSMALNALGVQIDAGDERMPTR
jgi:alkylhydroperoxidase family enzyme